jgi:hypothetical protein
VTVAGVESENGWRLSQLAPPAILTDIGVLDDVIVSVCAGGKVPFC